MNYLKNKINKIKKKISNKELIIYNNNISEYTIISNMPFDKIGNFTFNDISECLKKKEEYDKDINYYTEIKGEKQILINGAEGITKPIREIAILLMYSDKRLFIDSVCQHIASALNIPSTVCWIINNPKVFGYELHDNIITDAKIVHHTTQKSYLQPSDITGKPNEYPFDTKTLFNVNDIIKSLEKDKSYDIQFEI